MIYLATDIGFGSTKTRAASGIFKFPSAVALRKNAQADIASDDVFHYEGKDYFVGDLAIRDALTTKDYSFLEKYAPLLLYKSIRDSQIDPRGEINLATGLSLLNWNKREDFAAKITDFIVNKTHVDKISVKIIPQGKGIYVDCLQQDPELNNELVLIVDIGYNTLDVIPFEFGKALAHEAWATSQGMNLIIDELRKQLNREYQMSMNEAKINQIMQKGGISIDGEERDLSAMIGDEVHNYKEIILNELQTRNPDIYKSAKKIIFAGGGAYTLKDQDFAKKSIRFAPGKLEFSNVQGYWKILAEGGK